jgi:hypothetical protein
MKDIKITKWFYCKTTPWFQFKILPTIEINTFEGLAIEFQWITIYAGILFYKK